MGPRSSYKCKGLGFLVDNSILFRIVLLLLSSFSRVLTIVHLLSVLERESWTLLVYCCLLESLGQGLSQIRFQIELLMSQFTTKQQDRIHKLPISYRYIDRIRRRLKKFSNGCIHLKSIRSYRHNFYQAKVMSIDDSYIKF